MKSKPASHQAASKERLRQEPERLQQDNHIKPEGDSEIQSLRKQIEELKQLTERVTKAKPAGKQQLNSKYEEILAKVTQVTALQVDQSKQLQKLKQDLSQERISANIEIKLLREENQRKDEQISELETKLRAAEHLSSKRASVISQMQSKEEEILTKDSQLKESQENAKSAALLAEAEKEQLKQQLQSKEEELRRKDEIIAGLDTGMQKTEHMQRQAETETKQLKQQLTRGTASLVSKSTQERQQGLERMSRSRATTFKRCNII